MNIDEKAVSKEQQRLMGMALAYKRGKLDGGKVSEKVKELADKMSEKDLEKFAKTKHDDLEEAAKDWVTDHWKQLVKKMTTVDKANQHTIKALNDKLIRQYVTALGLGTEFDMMGKEWTEFAASLEMFALQMARTHADYVSSIGEDVDLGEGSGVVSLPRKVVNNLNRVAAKTINDLDKFITKDLGNDAGVFRDLMVDTLISQLLDLKLKFVEGVEVDELQLELGESVQVTSTGVVGTVYKLDEDTALVKSDDGKLRSVDLCDLDLHEKQRKWYTITKGKDKNNKFKQTGNQFDTKYGSVWVKLADTKPRLGRVGQRFVSLDLDPEIDDMEHDIDLYGMSDAEHVKTFIKDGIPAASDIAKRIKKLKAPMVFSDIPDSKIAQEYYEAMYKEIAKHAGYDYYRDEYMFAMTRFKK